MLGRAVKYRGLAQRLATQPSAKQRCQPWSTASGEDFIGQEDIGNLPECPSCSGRTPEAASAQRNPGHQGCREHTGPLKLSYASANDAASVACRACATQQSNILPVASYARLIHAASIACRACATLQSSSLPVASWARRAHALLRYNPELGQQRRGMILRRRPDKGAVREPPARLNVKSSRPADTPVRLVAEDGTHR